MKMKLTREFADAIGWDEADRSMLAAGRKVWNEEDYAIACETFRRVWPLCVHHADREACAFCLQESAQSNAAASTTRRKRSDP